MLFSSIRPYANQEGFLYAADYTPPAMCLVCFGKNYVWTDRRNLEGAPQVT